MHLPHKKCQKSIDDAVKRAMHRCNARFSLISIWFFVNFQTLCENGATIDIKTTIVVQHKLKQTAHVSRIFPMENQFSFIANNQNELCKWKWWAIERINLLCNELIAAVAIADPNHKNGSCIGYVLCALPISVRNENKCV